MSKSITRNYIYNLSYQILIIVLPLITLPYLSRILGADGIGKYDATQAIVQYFVLLGTLGLNMYGQREIAYVQNDTRKRSRIFYELMGIKAITMAFSITVYCILMLQESEYRILYVIQLIDLIANAIDVTWFFTGIEEFRLTVFRNALVRILAMVFIFLFVKTAADVPLYVLAQSLPILLGNLSIYTHLKRYLCRVPLKALQLKQHLRPMLALFIPQVAVQVYAVFDKTMIFWITSSDAAVGYYGQAQRLTRLVLTIVTSICTVMLPRMSNVFANKDYDTMKRYMMNSFSFAYLLGLPLMVGLICVIGRFIPWFYGDGYEPAIFIAQILALTILLIAFSNMIGFQYLLPAKRQKEYTISITTGAIVNFILNLICIRLWGAPGAAIATVAAEASVTAVQLFFVRKDFSLPAIAKSSWRCLIAVSVMALTVLALGTLSDSHLMLLIQVACGALVYLILLLLLREPFLLQSVQMIQKKLRK